MSSVNKRRPRHRAESPKLGHKVRRRAIATGIGVAVLVSPITAGAVPLDSLTSESQATVAQSLSRDLAGLSPTVTVAADVKYDPFGENENGKPVATAIPPKTTTTAMEDFIAEQERAAAEAEAAAEAARARQAAQEASAAQQGQYQASNASSGQPQASQQASSNSGNSAASYSATEGSSASGDQVVAIARQYLDVPYVWGGSSPSGWDCSGFTSFIYAQVGINIPQGSSAQRNVGREIPASEARPGDLMWWPGHVGIYTGNGNHIAARNPSSGTQETPIYRSNPVYLRVVG